MAALVRDNLKKVRVDFGSMPQDNVPPNLAVQQLFDQALSTQQQKNGDEALKLYQQALDKGQAALTSAQLSVVYHNMSTIAYDKSDFLHAYVWSKKALALDPGNHIAQQAFEQYAKKFEKPNIAHQISTSQNIQKGLEKAPIDLLYLVCLVLFVATLRLFFKSILTKRKNHIEMVPDNTFAWKPLVSFLFLLVFLGLTAVRHTLDQRTLAIFLDKTGVQTAAGENKPVIFEAQSGLEVEVLQFSDSYAQVRYPGAFSGWVPLKNLEVLTYSNTTK